MTGDQSDELVERLISAENANAREIEQFILIARGQGFTREEMLQRAADISPRAEKAIRAALDAGL